MPIEVLITIPFAENLITRLTDISPGIKVTAIQAQRASEIPAEVWARTEVLYTGHILPTPAQAPSLRWIQFHYAGIDQFIEEPIIQKEGMLITTLSGAAAPQMGEHVLAMILAMSRKIPAILENQKKREWPKDRFERFAPFELGGKTIGILGYGSTGRQIARLLHPFGVKIYATKHNLMNTSDPGYISEEHGDPDGDLVARMYPAQAMKSMLKECHVVVVTLPLTKETANVLNANMFAALKPGAYLVVVSRGGTVNTGDMIEALKNGQLAGAALDVFPEEPLPPSSPLWQIPGVIISPHISGGSTQYNERAIQLFSQNLQRYLLGATLYNIFNLQRGY